jgi:hypothetical protein
VSTVQPTISEAVVAGHGLREGGGDTVGGAPQRRLDADLSELGERPFGIRPHPRLVALGVADMLVAMQSEV